MCVLERCGAEVGGISSLTLAGLWKEGRKTCYLELVGVCTYIGRSYLALFVIYLARRAGKTCVVFCWINTGGWGKTLGCDWWSGMSMANTRDGSVTGANPCSLLLLGAVMGKNDNDMVV